MPTLEHPLVSIALFCYNQEFYIRDALLSVIAQDYPNFEIVVSDDCSKDETLRVVREVAAEHRGNINIKIKSSDVNKGIAKNVYDTISDCRGEYIVLAAGDDISLPDRVSRSIDYINERKDVFLVFGNVKLIKNDVVTDDKLFRAEPDFCRNIDDFLSGKKVWSLGASITFQRSLLDKFGSFLKGTFQEDGCLSFRCILLGELGYINEPLVLYRVHDNGASQSLTVMDKVEYKVKDLRLIDNYMKDYLLARVDDEIFFELVKRKVLTKILVFFLKNRLSASLAFFLSKLLRSFRGG